jgi:hypothetical protein
MSLIETLMHAVIQREYRVPSTPVMWIENAVFAQVEGEQLLNMIQQFLDQMASFQRSVFESKLERFRLRRNLQLRPFCESA